MVQERSAGAVVCRKERGKLLYLVLHYASGHWDFVKGNIEEGEEEKETVKRECEEETGIKDLKILPGFRERITYYYRRDGRTIFKEVVFYPALTHAREVSLSHEHQGFRWLEYAEALEQVTYSNSKKVLEKADKFLKTREKQGIP